MARSQCTSKIRIGHGVRLLPFPYNHPIRAAEMGATLDLLCDGRMEFGTGRSATKVELEGFGINPNETRALWEEALDIVVGAWTNEVFSWEGRYFKIPPRRVVPKPFQKPHPPLCICKALFMGGVTRRFPTLQFAFLECGVAWACSLYSDLIGHWKKRNAQAVERYNPERLDRDVLVDLFRRYGDKVTKGRLERVDQIAAMGLGTKKEEKSMLDEWAPCAIEKAEDIKDLFVPHFFFGCESDDPITACAFNRRMNPFGARLNAIFSSDIGHWDVPDMREVTEEAYELVEQEIITEDDFCDFTFRNPARLWAGMNPDFFKGTVVEKAVTKLLSQRT